MLYRYFEMAMKNILKVDFLLFITSEDFKVTGQVVMS